MPWPPTPEDLKLDLDIDDVADDSILGLQLDAAVTFVERVHKGRFNFAGAVEPEPGWDCPDPGPDLELGTIRLAGRWHTRRRSPDGLVSMAEMGAARVTSFDPDIDRMLRIGRHARPRVG